MSLRRTVCAVAMLLVIGQRQVTAQSATPSSGACTYQTCGLRIEPVFLGTALVKGSSGEQVARLGGFGGGVELLLTGPDSAAMHARTYVRSTKTGTLLGLGAVAAYAAAAWRTDNFRGHATGADVALTIGSAGLVIASLPYAVRAQRALSRAVWWYNGALPR